MSGAIAPAGEFAAPSDVNFIHIWLLHLGETDSASAELSYPTLSEAEHQRAKKFVDPHARHQFLQSRALLREVLSRYVPIPPAQWEFAERAGGRPFVVNPHHTTSIDFNLSHTEGLIGCAVTCIRGCEFGIDVENIRREPGPLLLSSKRIFSSRELTALAALTLEPRRALFYRLWTLKEAYAKADGLGLPLGLSTLDFQLLGDNEGACLSIGADIGAVAGWRFVESSPTADHRLALALRDSLPPRISVAQYWNCAD